MEFRTIKEDGQVQEEIKKSRFICHIKRVTTEEEARNFIQAVKKEHYKATHNCSAFILGEQSEIKRSSRSEEHTSELQSRLQLVCRLLLGKKI